MSTKIVWSGDYFYYDGRRLEEGCWKESGGTFVSRDAPYLCVPGLKIAMTARGVLLNSPNGVRERCKPISAKGKSNFHSTFPYYHLKRQLSFAKL